MRQVSRCTITVILEQEHFQSFPERWQWNVQQTEVGLKTVPHDWPVNGKTTLSVVCPRTWNSELTGLSRAQVTPTAAWWRWLAVCRQVWRSHAVPTFVYQYGCLESNSLAYWLPMHYRRVTSNVLNVLVISWQLRLKNEKLREVSGN